MPLISHTTENTEISKASRLEPNGKRASGSKPPAIDQLIEARAQTDALFDLIDPAALYDRPIPERHRLIFYLGHLEAFDWNQICRAALDRPSFHPAFDKLFEFGIDPEPGKAPSDQPADWPATGEVLAYNRDVRARVDRDLANAPQQVVDIAIEHRLMHAETFAYLMHALPHDRKRGGARVNHGAAGSPRDTMIGIPGGRVTLGQDSGHFGWDNEFDQHPVAVPAFRIARHKVTNGEYLRFVKEGAPVPHFWTARDGSYFYRGMFESVPLPLDHPVYSTHDEARAYAAWAGKSLITEAQFHRAAYGAEDGRESAYPWGNARPHSSMGNFDFGAWDPVSVAATPQSDSAFGVSQLAGNGWEWTSTEFGPFPGFKPFPAYPGYSQSFFDGRHYVLKGGSPRTAAALLRRSFRNWFRPNYPYVYATFRLVDNG